MTLFKSKSLVLSLASLGSGLLSGVSLLILAYSIGDLEFGKLAYCNAVLALASPISSFGVRGGLAALLPRQHSMGKFLTNSLALQVVGSLVSSSVLLSLALMQHDSLVRAILIIYIIPLWLDSAEVFTSALIVRGQIAIVSTSIFASSLTASLSRLALIILRVPIVAFAIPTLIQRLVLYGFQLQKFRIPTKKSLIGRLDVNCQLDILTFSVPVLITSFGISVYTYIDQLMLPAYVGYSGLGSYSLAVTILSFCFFVPVSIGRVWEPALHRAYAEQDYKELARIKSVYMRRTLLASLFAMAATLIFAYAAKPFAALDKYKDSYLYIQHMSMQIALVGIGGCYYSALSRLNSWKWAYALLCAFVALLNITLNIYCIPLFGVLGAIWSTNISLSVLCIACVLTAKHRQPAHA